MKRRRSPRKLFIGTLIALALLAVPVLYASYRLSLRAVQASGAPAYREYEVKPGQNAQTIATALKSADLIRDRNAFITYINLHGLRPRLKVGLYSLSQTMSADQIADRLASGKTLSKRLIIPEGYRISQIETAADALGVSKASLAAAIAAPHSQSFLAGKPASVGLEGYLFPDSYELTATTTASMLVNAMLDNFARRVGPEYAQAFAAQGLTLHQGLTMASVVEREVSIPADRPVVAQIFLKRFRTGMPLGADATTLYASQLLGIPFNLDANSPYNTRKFTGLPPGPICSPGLSSMDAVSHPAKTDYLYFISGKDGKTYFAKTFAEHQANIAAHL